MGLDLIHIYVKHDVQFHHTKESEVTFQADHIGQKFIEKFAYIKFVFHTYMVNA
jgi:hypothetical protein